MFDFFGSIGSMIMTPLYYGVSGIILLWHRLFSQVMDPDSGWTWALSIVGLTITIRALLIPLFVKQINASRNMQLIQPQLTELRKKYGHDRERFAQEQMKLFQESGTNPFSSCLPILIQMPIFFALFRVIERAAREGAAGAKGFLTPEDAESLQNAAWMGGKIADTFMSSDHLETKIIAMVMVIIMSATQFFTQKQLMAKNMPPEALNGPFAQQQKMLLYILPIVFAVSGVAFPLGVLVYWTVSNLWTMGQQFWVIRANPAPGTPAFAAKQERDRKKGKQPEVDPSTLIGGNSEPKPPTRKQPKSQSREQRRKNQGGSNNSSPEK
ncbi:MAG: membrane protein insertase YidC [Aeromicrobium sp.]|nr:MAG: membrane protein insertase YidC [Aeromicrobium sp.]